MRRLALLAVALVVALVLFGPARPALASATTADALPAIAAAGQATGQDDKLEEGEDVGEGDAKDLPVSSILVTLAVIVVAGFAVVLAGLGYFTPEREGG